jgi:ribonuclease J
MLLTSKKSKDQIVGMLLSHGHDDHIAGLPYILPQIGTHFPIFGSPLTIGFAKDRLKEFGINPNFQTLPLDALP